VRELVLKKLEDKREAGEIGSGLEAKVVLTPRDAVHGKILTDEKDNLRYIFIVSQVELNDIPAHKEGASSDTVVAVHVEKAAGRKCQRCWNYSEGVGRDERHPNLCERCLTAV
jgi:isoleucyl-tRNA synthetase